MCQIANRRLPVRVLPGEPNYSTKRLAVSPSCERRPATPLWIRTPGTIPRARYTAIWVHQMAAESLTEVVQPLTPQEQDAVRQFIDYLKGRDASVRSQSPFLQAADDFIATQPELLHRLAQ